MISGIWQHLELSFVATEVNGAELCSIFVMFFTSVLNEGHLLKRNVLATVYMNVNRSLC